MTQGSVFCLLYMKKNGPRKNDPCLNIKKLYLTVLKNMFHVYIEKASQYFDDFIRNRDLPNTWVVLEFNVVLIMCFATVLWVGAEGLFLSIYLLCKSTNIQHIALTPR